MSEAKGTKKKIYDQHHREYVELLKGGVTDLEAQVLLGISLNQLRRHQAQAFSERAERREPSYATMLWKDLPREIQRLLPTAGEKQIIRLDPQERSVSITLL